MALKLRTSDMYLSGEVQNYADGTKELVRKAISYTPTVYDDYHEVKPGDTLDKIAYLFYSNFVDDSSKYWWVIADVNGIDNPLDLTDLVGQRLLIPNFTRLQLIL